MARLRRLGLSCCAALAVAHAMAPVSSAASDAPQVDPNSPAGTEYQLPVQRARELAGRATGTTGAPDQPPLFGVGVQKATAPRGSRSTDRVARTHTSTPNDPPPLARAPGTLSAQAAAPEGGGLLPIAAGAAGVLLLGGVAGLAWRRRSRRRATTEASS